MNDMVVLLITFGICSVFLWIFSHRSATRNTAFYITFVMWVILVYECIRYQFPEALTLPQPYRMIQHRAELLLLAIYGWEAVKYVARKIVEKDMYQFETQDD